MKLKNGLILLMSILLFSQCNKDDEDSEMESTINCPQEFNVGSFPLLDSSKALFPYALSEGTMVFSDSTGNEIIATRGEIFESFNLTVNDNALCLENTADTIRITAETESINTSVTIPLVDLRFDIRFRVSPDLVNYKDTLAFDVANIICNRISFADPTFSNPIPQIIILLDERTRPGVINNSAIPEPSLTINGKEFLEVYTNTIGNDVIEVYYSHDQGIVGFKDNSTGTLYGFERFE